MQELGKSLIVFGILLAVVGALITLAGRLPIAGRLPGDILIQKKNLTFYFPLATSLLISAVLSLIFWLMSRK